MSRKDIPNLIGKHVTTTGLQSTEWNGQVGLVVEWNDERKRFAVKMDSDGSVKLFKPYNLHYTLRTQNKKEKKLAKLVATMKLVDFENGIKLFDQLQSSEKYVHTYLKLFWLRNLWNIQAQQDRRYIPKIAAALENIIETSQFEDLVVSAKIQLAETFFSTQNLEHITELCMSCIGAHYGCLPELFCLMGQNIQVNFEIVKDLYFRAKQMIANKICSKSGLNNFIDASVNFLIFCESHDSLVNVKEECIFLRKTLELLDSSVGVNSMCIARVCMLEKNYEVALRNVQIYQESITSDRGNVDVISRCYASKVECYIKLGNKSMAKKVLQKFKRFRHLPGTNRLIVGFEKSIKNMSNANSTNQAEEAQEIRTKTQCSSHECTKVEPHVGAFKHCGRCRLKYYCSIKCQKKHWRNGHEEECQEFEN